MLILSELWVFVTEIGKPAENREQWLTWKNPGILGDYQIEEQNPLEKTSSLARMAIHSRFYGCGLFSAHQTDGRQ